MIVWQPLYLLGARNSRSAGAFPIACQPASKEARIYRLQWRAPEQHTRCCISRANGTTPASASVAGVSSPTFSPVLKWSPDYWNTGEDVCGRVAWDRWLQHYSEEHYSGAVTPSPRRTRAKNAQMCGAVCCWSTTYKRLFRMCTYCTSTLNM